MAAPRHIRITHSGVFGSPAAPYEIWSHGLSAAPDKAGLTAGPNFPALVLALQQAWGNLALRLGTEVTLTRTRVAMVSGPRTLVEKRDDGSYYQNDSTTQTVGASGAQNNLAVALAVSTHSLVAGSTGRGRFFLPLPDLGVLVAGRLAGTVQSAMANSAAAYLDAVNSALDVNNAGPVVVASGGSVKQGIPPRLNVVRSIRVGRVPDTIRSRRNDLDESYLRVALK